MASEVTSAYLEAIAEATGSGRCDARQGADLWMTWDMLREMRASKVAVLVPEADVRVARGSTRAENHSAVLDRTVRIPEPRTNHSYFRP